MNEVYILTITTEMSYEHPVVQVFVYRDMESALRAYSVEVDKAREEAEDYESPHEEKEIATESFRCFRILDCDCNDAITVEVQAKEIIGDDSEDI